MTDAPRHRDASRERLRAAIADAARDLTVAGGWDAVRMADVARAAGVSRQTVYNEYGDRAGLAEAVARREIDRFLAGVREALHAHGPDVRAAAYAAIRHVLAEGADNPLVKAILTNARGGADPLLPYLTTRPELVLVGATAVLQEWAAQHLPDLRPESFAFGAESVIRLVVSHLVFPLGPVERTASDLADLTARLVADARRPPA
jgi:AcrR family transcriptional regulator